jgi:hypothetical protein
MKMADFLLTFELEKDADALCIHGDEVGLRKLQQAISQLLLTTDPGHFNHEHLKTPAWGGVETIRGVAGWSADPTREAVLLEGDESAGMNAGDLLKGLSNNAIKLTVHPVTHLAVARCAPVWPAAYRVR